MHISTNKHTITQTEGERVSGPTALHLAIQQGEEVMVQLLMEHSCDLSALCYHNGNTKVGCLHLAAQLGHVSICMLLLGEEGCKREAVMETEALKDITALHWACMHRQREVVCVLLEKGCDVTAKCSDGSTALHLSCLRGNYQIVEVILKHGGVIYLPNQHNLFPLHLAIKSGSLETVKLVVEKGCDVEVRCNNISVLQMAVIENELKIVELLVDSGALVNKRTAQELSPLHEASERGYASIVEFLLKKGAMVNLRASNSNCIDVTSLHLASMQGHEDVVNILINFKAETNCEARVYLIYRFLYFRSNIYIFVKLNNIKFSGIY